jgi:hypothetical protein
VVSTRITQVERASGARPTLELARALDAALGADGLLVDLWPHVYRESFPDWSRTFMAYSAHADAIRQYTAHVVPGLLQTEEYARAVLSVCLSHREERLAARLERQKRLHSLDRPELLVILDETVLRKRIGGDDVMRRQLARLLKAAAEPHITVQVLPFDEGAHDVLGGSLTVLTLRDGSEVAYTEGADHGRLFEDRDDVRRLAVAYDRLRAAALPPRRSLHMIRSAMEEDHRDPQLPSRSARRRLAQEQLQQSGGRRLRRGGRRNPRRGSGT